MANIEFLNSNNIVTKEVYEQEVTTIKTAVGDSENGLVKQVAINVSDISTTNLILQSADDSTVGVVPELAAVKTAVNLLNTSGATANRPEYGDTAISASFFDTDLGLPIWWSGEKWVKSDGTDA